MNARVHTCERFTFVADASMDQVFPLLGALRERDWAPGWEPRFLWPEPAGDREGMVFEIEHAAGLATWTNTAFDAGAGRVGYVYVIPGVMSTRISIALRPQRTATRVDVSYERTALSDRADAAVQALALQDRGAGAEWAAQINGYLSGRGAARR